MKKLLIFGNLGRDPELMKDSNGNEFATFVVAVEGSKKYESKSEWIEVSCTGKLVDVVTRYVMCPHLSRPFTTAL
jgi:single-stranded DNA-binding protein